MDLRVKGREGYGWVKAIIASWSSMTTAVGREYGPVLVSRKVEQEI